jgi:hypothetical protein
MKFFCLTILFVVASCASPQYIVGKEEFKKIPKGSRRVIVSTDYPADSLFNVVARILAKDAWPVQSDRTAMQITSLGRSIGSGTFMRPNVFIEPGGSGSKAYFAGEWLLDANGQIVMQSFANKSNYGSSRIVFGKTGTTKTDMAFQKLVMLARKIENGRISYSQ